jgi:hypothetical protein
MPIEVSCASCSGQFRLPDSAAGKKIRCPKCRATIEVPAAEPATSRPTEVITPAPPPPPVPAAPSAPPPQPAFVPPPAPKKQPSSIPPPAISEAPPPPLPPPSLSPPSLPPPSLPPPSLSPPSLSPPADEWHFKTAAGEEYGPVGRDELDEWFREGRITAECQILRATDEEWQWASEIYPQLKPPAGQESGVGSQESDSSSEAVLPLPPDTRPQSPPASAPKKFPKSPGKATKSAPVQSDEEDCSQRSRLVAGFLGVFLGPLGIHRFYLGYWGVGLAMLVTAGGLGLWSLIDAIFVMTGRVPDADGRPLSP